MLRLLLLVSLLLSCSPVSREPTLPKHIVLPDLNQVVGIQSWCVRDNEGTIEVFSGRGTAQAIGPDRIITAQHVVTCGFEGDHLASEITLKDGRTFEVALAAEGSEEVDVAILKTVQLAPVFKRWAILSAMPVVRGQQVCIASANPGLNWRINCAKVLKHRSGPGWAGKGSYQYTGFYIGGSSGSAIFDENGLIVGIHVGSSNWGGYGIGYEVSSFKHLLN